MTIADETIAAFLHDLAAPMPTPGGGGASAVIAATAASLGSMVLSYAINKPRYAEHADLHASARAHLASAASAFLALADADATAYAALNAAFALPKSDPIRSSAIAASARSAIEIPLAAAQRAAALAEQLASLRSTTSPQLASDLTIAAITAEAACRAFHQLVLANAPLLASPAEAQPLTEQSQSCCRCAAAALALLTPTH